jgi:ribonuclease BN (tRNA processing enzyme)
MQLHFIGSGDAFGSGGRLNTCFHVVGNAANFLIDIGASSLIGIKDQGVKHNDIKTIFITHFHADHFGGLPFFMLNAQFSHRTEPLTIAGPAGLSKWYEQTMETAFVGSSKTKPKFDHTLVELRPGQRTSIDDVVVTPYQAVHGEPGGPFLAYRFEVEGRTIAYTGDTEWTEDLVCAGFEVDVFIAEAYFFEKKVKLHLDVDTLRQNLDRVRPKRLVLTHMSDDVLSRMSWLPYETAFDGLVIEL